MYNVKMEYRIPWDPHMLRLQFDFFDPLKSFLDFLILVYLIVSQVYPFALPFLFSNLHNNPALNHVTIDYFLAIFASSRRYNLYENLYSF